MAPNVKMTFTKDDFKEIDVKGKKLYISLTQHDTLSFAVGKVKVQARMLMSDGAAFATQIEELDVGGILSEGVMEDVEDPDEGSGEEPEDPDEGSGDGPDGGDEAR